VGTPSMKDRESNKSLSRVALVICILLLPIIVANLTIIIGSFLHPDEVPGFLGYKPFIVLSDSMLPTISSGDLVLVKEVDVEKLEQGDVIAFREGTSVVTHRIVEVMNEGDAKRFRTKGDNNNVADPLLVRPEMVEGVYLLGIPGLGRAAMFIQTPVGMTLVIALPLILFVTYEAVRRKKVDRERQERTEALERELERMRERITKGAEDPDRTNDKPE
jgi:signal peptidase